VFHYILALVFIIKVFVLFFVLKIFYKMMDAMGCLQRLPNNNFLFTLLKEFLDYYSINLLFKFSTPNAKTDKNK